MRHDQWAPNSPLKTCFCGLYYVFVDDNIDETYGVNVQFESDEEVSLLLKTHTYSLAAPLSYTCFHLVIRREMRTCLERSVTNTRMRIVKERRQTWAALSRPT